MKHYRVDKMRNMEVLKLPRSEASLKQRVDLIGEVLWPELQLLCCNPGHFLLPCSRKEYAVCCQLLLNTFFRSERYIQDHSHSIRQSLE